MKPIKTKAQIRAEIDSQIESYLASGGEVNAIANGISGNTTNSNLFAHSTTFEPKQERTPVFDIVRDLEERKRNKPLQSKVSKRPKKKLITDDFGEPIRWVWLDN